jgi:hypothetical protein
MLDESRIFAKLIHEIRFAYPQTKVLGKFCNVSDYMVQKLSTDIKLAETVLEKGKAGIQTFTQTIEKTWLNGRPISDGTKQNEQCLSERGQTIIANMTIEEQPHRILIGFGENVFSDPVDIYQYVSRGNSFEIHGVDMTAKFRITVKNSFNCYGDEAYIFALRTEGYGISFEVADSEGSKGTCAARVFEYNENEILIDRLSKYRDDSLLIRGVR